MDTRGFTLIEVIIALAILLFGIGAVMLLFPASLESARRAAERTVSSQTAHSVVSQIRASSGEALYNDRLPIGLLDYPIFDQTSGAINLYGYSTSVQRLSGAAEVYLQRVTFTVEFADGSSESFTTFVTQQ